MFKFISHFFVARQNYNLQCTYSIIKSVSYKVENHLISLWDIKDPGAFVLVALPKVFVFGIVGHTFQRQIVSSAAALATILPSGEARTNKIRDVWFFRSATLAILGYFQTVSWFCENPWPETISLYSAFQTREQTYI